MITICDSEKRVCKRCKNEFSFHELSGRPADVCRKCITPEEEKEATKCRQETADWICSDVWD